MTRRLVVIVLIIVITGAQVRAQYNDSTFYHANFGATGIINRTSLSDSYVINSSVKFGVNKKRFAANASGSWVYGKQDQTLSNNDATATVDLTYTPPTGKFYYWALGVYEESVSLKIDYRYQAGAGVGYNAVNNDWFSLNISEGLLYEKGSLENADELGRSRYETLRNSLRVKFSFSYGDNITFESTAFWQPAFEDRLDYIIKSNTSLLIKLLKGLDFTTALNYNKTSATNRENLLLTLGLTFDRYF